MSEKFRRNFAFICRRFAYFTLVIGSTALASSLMSQVLAGSASAVLGVSILVLFSLTFGWLAMGFWTAAMGFAVRLVGGDPHGLSLATTEVPLRQRTALVMPIYNEETGRVAAGIEACLMELVSVNPERAFDFFVLSDTTDPVIAQREVAAISALKSRFAGEIPLYYRRRQRNIGRKAGNIEDFVHRWGAAYAHMIVLDADSVMSGPSLRALAQMMEANPSVGIIQTIPTPVNRQTPFARILQFAAQLYGPVMASGLAFWAGAEANYYGHNAIIRLQAFARHCRLPVLPGPAPLGGEILSHDFVEAALIRRAGWQVWLVPDLPGSFEEMPANILDYAKRDRRWCQGNLQHARLLSMPGLKMMSRLHLAMGVTSYVSAPLWLALLVLSSVDACERAITGPIYWKPGFNLFPSWPVATDYQTHLLLIMTLCGLFLPKLMGLALVLVSRRRRRGFGGLWGLLASVGLETVFSVLLAPVMMLFQTLFVTATLLGRSVSWDAQPRDDRGLSWGEALARHAGQTGFGLIWGAVVGMIAPDFLWWLSPVLAGLIIAIPLSVWSSRTQLGQFARRFGLFMTPEEISAPAVLQALQGALNRDNSAVSPASSAQDGLVPSEAGLVMAAFDWGHHPLPDPIRA